MFHLTTHACFKALLFLCAGSVIHALHGEQDMFKMGGLWRRIPITYATMWLGALALAGIPPFAGWWSKDAIIDGAFAVGGGPGLYGWVLGVVTAFITALYSARLIFLVFHGAPRDAHLAAGAHESPLVMTIPLLVLSLGAVFAGWLLYPYYIGAGQAAFWNGAIFARDTNPVLELVDHLPAVITLVPSVAAFAGLLVAIGCYVLRPEVPSLLAARLRPLYLFLLNNWYFDELYDAILVRPYHALASLLWHGADEGLIDGSATGLARLTTGGSVQLVRLQTGSIAVYAFTMLIGLLTLTSVFLIFG
jgi:NADH-quinone oxidoreductase subunit L